MSLRRYLFEWYSEPGTARVGRHVVRAADAKDALVIFEKTGETSGLYLGYKRGDSYRVQAVANNACIECYGTGRVDMRGDGNFNIVCSNCGGKGAVL